jgi:hypothetical protein
MTRLVAFVFLAACSAGVPGDPDTLVINGDPQAGYAWSGPSSWCCTVTDFTPRVAWQIWFTNTEECPTSNADIVGIVYIISSETVQPPSTELPALTSMTLQIVFPSGVDFTRSADPVAELGAGKNAAYPPLGTLMLRTYSADEITGVIAARTEDNRQNQLEITGRFDAHRCDRIHD